MRGWILIALVVAVGMLGEKGCWRSISRSYSPDGSALVEIQWLWPSGDGNTSAWLYSAAGKVNLGGTGFADERHLLVVWSPDGRRVGVIIPGRYLPDALRAYDLVDQRWIPVEEMQKEMDEAIVARYGLRPEEWPSDGSPLGLIKKRSAALGRLSTWLSQRPH